MLPVVLDVGTTSLRFGFSDRHSPSVVLCYDEPDKCKRPPLTYTSGVGLALDVEALESVVSNACTRLPLPKGSEEHKVLFVEPTQAPRGMRQNVAEVLFERLGMKHVFFAKRAPLSAFALGLTTAAVLDAGASHSSCAVVQEGWVVPGSVFDCAMGGDYLDSALLAHLETCGTDPLRAFTLEKARAVKEVACHLTDGPPRCPSTIDLPDGTQLHLHPHHEALRNIPERIFVPEALQKQAQVLQYQLPASTAAVTGQFEGLPRLLATSIGMYDTDLQKKLLREHGVVLTGGTTRIPGFAARMNRGLREIVSPISGPSLATGTGNSCSTFLGSQGGGIRCLTTLTDPELGLQHSSWTGGAILASIGLIADLWVSREGYKERGLLAFEERSF